MKTEIYIARWKDGTFTFLFGQTQKTLLHALDAIDDPEEAEVRAVPPEVMREVTFDQKKKDSDKFEIDAEVEEMIWRECKQQIWPLEALGS
jgi:hypothetical protein